jgi:peroxiredoxin
LSEAELELPRPRDDGAAAHLNGAELAAIELPASDGKRIALSDLLARTVVFVHPSIGGIGDSLLDEWTAIPGARGCTPEACNVRDRLDAFRSQRIEVLGLSGQSTAEQRDAAERLRLPYPLLSDQDLRLARDPGLPTFDFHGRTYFRRVTLVLSVGKIEAALYPVFPPDQAAGQALAWLAQNPPRYGDQSAPPA